MWWRWNCVEVGSSLCLRGTIGRRYFYDVSFVRRVKIKPCKFHLESNKSENSLFLLFFYVACQVRGTSCQSNGICLYLAIPFKFRWSAAEYLFSYNCLPICLMWKLMFRWKGLPSINRPHLSFLSKWYNNVILESHW